MSVEISLQGIRLWLGGREILKNLSFDVQKGEIFAVVGGSGSGKTSLLRCVSRLVRPSQGQLIMFGHDIVKLDEAKLLPFRQRMGVVFQYSALFDSMSVAENVGFALRYARGMPPAKLRAVVAEKLQMVGLSGTEAMFPDQLSGGMQKRVGLARALATEPQVLLYDEPTSGLDPVMASDIYRLICQMSRNLGVTSLLVTHDIERVLQIADRICMLQQGEMVFLGTPQEMKSCENPVVSRFVREGTSPDLKAAARVDAQ